MVDNITRQGDSKATVVYQDVQPQTAACPCQRNIETLAGGPKPVCLVDWWIGARAIADASYSVGGENLLLINASEYEKCDCKTLITRTHPSDPDPAKTGVFGASNLKLGPDWLMALLSAKCRRS